MLYIDDFGVVDADRVKVKIFHTIERGIMDGLNGIAVHQTDSPTAQATFNSYQQKGSNGAHFLIDKDGTIYQTASLMRVTHHVGTLRSRCIETKKCAPIDLKKALDAEKHGYTSLSRHEMQKSWPFRYPSNLDSIGVELVGVAKGSDEQKVYEAVTDAQNASLKWLVSELISTFCIYVTEVYRHPDLSYKRPSEAETERW